ncbi:hypothetical protein CMEL01_08767, partial [Colletotrichum melonis]
EVHLHPPAHRRHPVASSVLPSRDLTERQLKKCKTFQIFRDPDAITGGSPNFVGTPQCCCQNEQCHVIDRVNGINTSANLNDFLAGTFTIEDARGQDKGTPGSNDIRGATYTVGAQGGCSKSGVRTVPDAFTAFLAAPEGLATIQQISLIGVFKPQRALWGCNLMTSSEHLNSALTGPRLLIRGHVHM